MRYRFVDCGYSLDRPEAGREAYLAGHIPGAAFLGIEELSDLSVSGKGRHPLPSAEAFAAAAGQAGIGDGVFVVAYDHGGAGGAARLWWLLRHFGHDDVAVLLGGIDSWAGPLQDGEEEEVEPAEFVPRLRAGDTIETDELAERLDQPGLVVVDVRVPERYRGEVEPYDPVAGRIPGAVNWPHPVAAQVPDEVARADEIVVYCGSGITACVNLLALAQAGRPDARLYPGSWSEWCSRGLPSETG